MSLSPTNKSLLLLFFRKEGLPAFLCAAMFAAVFFIFDLKIIARYVLADPPAWADELCVVLFIWIVFIANAVLVPDRQQISFDLLCRNVTPRWQRIIGVLRALLVGGVFAAALPGSLGYIAFLWRERTPVLQWRLDAVYACFGLFMVAVILRCAITLVRLLRGSWRAAL
jgi:TRAP-type C4-dicarboxylate transport system permease small subunit